VPSPSVVDDLVFPIAPKRKLAPVFNRLARTIYRPLEHDRANIIWISAAQFSVDNDISHSELTGYGLGSSLKINRKGEASYFQHGVSLSLDEVPSLLRCLKYTRLNVVLTLNPGSPIAHRSSPAEIIWQPIHSKFPELISSWGSLLNLAKFWGAQALRTNSPDNINIVFFIYIFLILYLKISGADIYFNTGFGKHGRIRSIQNCLIRRTGSNIINQGLLASSSIDSELLYYVCAYGSRSVFFSGGKVSILFWRCGTVEHEQQS